MNPIPSRRRLLQAAFGLGASPLLAGLAMGQTANWPTRPVTIIVPNAPGGPADTLARAVAIGMAKDLGVPVIIDNKPGAAGKIGIQALLRAPRDGQTIAVTSITALAAMPVFDRNVGYMSPDDFEPLSLAIRTPTVWCVHPSVPARNLKELIAYAKAHPGKLNYGSFGANSSSHLAQEDFFRTVDIQLTHVPYKGEAESLNALLADQVQVMMVSGAARPHIASGRLRGLATTTEQRWALLPTIPTARESGIVELVSYRYEPWIGFSAAAGVPTQVVTRLAEALKIGLQDPAVQSSQGTVGNRVVVSSPAQMRETVLQDMGRYHALARSGRVTPQ